MRCSAKAFVRRTHRVLPFGVLRKCSILHPLVPLYHIVSDEHAPHVEHLYPYKNTTQFRADLAFLLKYFRPVTLGDLLESLDTGRPLPANAFHMTFDDGHREVADVAAPILKELGIPATFFVNTGFLDNGQLGFSHKASLLIDRCRRGDAERFDAAAREVFADNDIPYTDFRTAMMLVKHHEAQVLDDIASRAGVSFDAYLAEAKPYLTCRQVRDLLSDGFTIGSHSIDHPLYELLPADRQVRQTMESMAQVKETFSLDYGAFAYPFCDDGVPAEQMDMLVESGCVDISFGTQIFKPTVHRRHLQRVAFDVPSIPARESLACLCRQHAVRRLRHRIHPNHGRSHD